MGVDGVKKIAYSINSLIINAAGYLNSYVLAISMSLPYALFADH
jgi:hypothetical protein